ncbi:MAG: AmmeMemoRadiSam system protein B [Candidatus Electryonea clarkiae]|nr:AmmeMemoRadiSam system protein B [Candidatus Electryonea clarkiae]MDP8288998.1 AmmeMemoRadiSam system protein B [Candidatus Electryonea clarkiae]
MKRFSRFLILISLIFCSCRAGSGNAGNGWDKVRPPAVAGSFYPSDAAKLEAAIHGYVKDAVRSEVDKPVALIVPHAGYIYSGQIAADAYSQAVDHEYDVVVILGTNHTTAGFSGVSVYKGSGYRTPLGIAEIDIDLAKQLINKDQRFSFNPKVHQREHSVEVQVPFIQVLFPGLKIVPVVMGAPDLQLCRDFGKALAEVIGNRNALVVASSDLSHYPGYEDAKKVDHKTLDAIKTFNPEEVKQAIEEQEKSGVANLSTCACGAGPIMTALTTAKHLGATTASVVSYANSGDVLTGDKSRVVGYGAVVLHKGKDIEKPPLEGKQSSLLSPDDPIPENDRKALIKLARTTITRYLETGTLPLVRDPVPSFSLKRGGFVTLEKDGRLRGCIGHMTDDLPLKDVVGKMALQAAFNDYRFKPVTLEEMDEIEIEISVLTPYKPVSSPEEIVVGRDGVMIKKSGKSAVYLPQVAPQQGWNREQMLDKLCQKAGLPAGSWRKGAEFLTFQAEVFKESGH